MEQSHSSASNSGTDNGRQRGRKRGASPEPFFTPIEFDVAEILKTSKKTSNVVDAQRATLFDKHKSYKSTRENTNRADLYNALLKYMRTTPGGIEELKTEKYFRKLDSAVFEVTSGSRGLTKKEELRKKYSQKLAKNLLGVVNGRKISAMTFYLHFLDVVNHSEKKSWISYVLGEAQDPEEQKTAEADALSFIKKVKADAVNQLNELEDEDTDYFVEYAIANDIVFLSICCGKQRRTRTRSTTKRSFGCFAYKVGNNALYACGTILPEAIEIMVQSLGFKEYVSQSLVGLGLPKMIEANTRVLHKFSMKEMKQKFVEDEQKRNEEGIIPFNPQREKLMKLQTALLHDELDAPNPIKKFHIDFCTPHFTEDGQVDETKAPSINKTTITLKGGNADEYFAEMYREGFITDIAPFLKLKQKRANALVLR